MHGHELFFLVRWIDRRRTAVTGVSYGGYVATRMLMEDGSGGEEGEDEEMLQCGVAVSPVVDWRFYGKQVAKVHVQVECGYAGACTSSTVELT